MDPVTVIAIAGLLTTAGAPLLHAWLAKRWQESARLRQLRMELYSDAFLYAQHSQSVTNHYTDPLDHSGPRLAKPPPADGISARMRLLAEPQVMQAWEELVKAQDLMGFIIAEDPSLRAGNLLDWRSPEVQRLNKAAERLYSIARMSEANHKAPRKTAIEK